jgi:hypothetical protein
LGCCAHAPDPCTTLAWLGERDERTPRNYEAAFYGFVRRIHARGSA